jgi:hypothetical protein
MIRKWTTKDGKEHVKEYAQIGNLDAKTYKCQQNRRYRAERRLRNPPSPPKLKKVCQPRVPVVSEEDVAKMKELHSLGLSFAKTGKLFGVSRYIAQSLIAP